MRETLIKPKRRRGRYSRAFKEDLLAQCRRPGASVPALARENGVGVQTLKRWLDETRSGAAAVGPDWDEDARAAAATVRPAFMPLQAMLPARGGGSIHIEVRQGERVLRVDWPVQAAGDCGRWLSGLLS